MEEINLDLESSSHKSINLDANNVQRTSMTNNISILKDDGPKDSNIGIDLLL